MELPVKKNNPPSTKGEAGGITDNNGVSLVEVMIALVVLLLVFMGLMQTALMSIDHNLRNILRDESISIGAMEMEQVRSELFDSIVSDTTAIPSGADCPTTFTTGNLIQRSMRNMTKDFCVNLTCRDLDNNKDCVLNDLTCNNRQLNIRVTWKWKGEDYLHSITTLRRR